MKDIKKVADIPNGVLLENKGLTDEISANTCNITWLYSLVKTYDKDFHAGNPVNPALLNNDGTPKKAVFVVSTFIGEKGYKKETSQFTDAKGSSATADTAAAKVSKVNISQPSADFNTESDKTGRKSDRPNQNHSAEETAPTSSAEYTRMLARNRDRRALEEQRERVRQRQERIQMEIRRQFETGKEAHYDQEHTRDIP